MDFTLRIEQPADYRAVENLTREAFWGSMNHSTCDGEHLLVHKLRELPCFVPELNYVAEVGGEIIGHIIYSMAKVVTPQEQEIEVLNFGPISVLPSFKRKGVGSALMRHTIAAAKKLGYRAIIFYGHPDYYPRFGFRRASEFGITAADGKSLDALMAMPLYAGALDGITGRYIEDAVYDINSVEALEFDKTFPSKDPIPLLPIARLTERLAEHVRDAFEEHGLYYISELQKFSGKEILGWGNISQQDLIQINLILKELGQPEKLLPSSAHFQDDDKRKAANNSAVDSALAYELY